MLKLWSWKTWKGHGILKCSEYEPWNTNTMRKGYIHRGLFLNLNKNESYELGLGWIQVCT